MKKKNSLLQTEIERYLAKKEEILTLKHQLDVEEEKNLQALLAAIILVGEEPHEEKGCEAVPLEQLFRGPAFKKKIVLQDFAEYQDERKNGNPYMPHTNRD